jgi:hypothetical protein
MQAISKQFLRLKNGVPKGSRPGEMKEDWHRLRCLVADKAWGSGFMSTLFQVYHLHISKLQHLHRPPPVTAKPIPLFLAKPTLASNCKATCHFRTAQRVLAALKHVPRASLPAPHARAHFWHTAKLFDTCSTVLHLRSMAWLW